MLFLINNKENSRLYAELCVCIDIWSGVGV